MTSHVTITGKVYFKPVISLDEICFCYQSLSPVTCSRHACQWFPIFPRLALVSHCQRLARLARLARLVRLVRLARFLNFSPFAAVTHFFASRAEYTLTRAWNQLIVFLCRSFPVMFVIFRDFDVDPFLSQADQHSWLPENCN